MKYLIVWQAATNIGLIFGNAFVTIDGLLDTEVVQAVRRDLTDSVTTDRPDVGKMNGEVMILNIIVLADTAQPNAASGDG